MDERPAFSLRDLHWNNLVFEDALFVCAHRLPMALKGEGVLLLATDLVFLSNVFGSVAVIEEPVELSKAMIRKAPSERAVIAGDVAPLKGGRAFSQHPRSPGHALNSSRNEE